MSEWFAFGMGIGSLIVLAYFGYELVSSLIWRARMRKRGK